MTMRTPKNTTRRGFSLIELQVVIAIIANLAALIFPAVMAQQKKAKRNSCAANMADIAGGLRIYRLDTGAYPPALFGFAHQPAEGSDPASGKTVVYGLYPHWVRNLSDFVCPDNPGIRGLNLTNSMRLPNGSDYTGTHMTPPLPAPDMRKGAWTAVHPPDPLYPSGIAFPIGDSYDAAFVPYTDYREDAANPAKWERHYQRQWTPTLDLSDPNVNLGKLPLLPVGKDSPQLEREHTRTYARQLVFQLPDDSTVVTSCTYHRDYPVGWTRGDVPSGGAITEGGRIPAGSIDVVLYLDGHTEFRQSQDFNVYQDMNGSTQWAGWQVPSK
jgi:prepilin-type N-terminal cleavage/methylation domain-containing protein